MFLEQNDIEFVNQLLIEAGDLAIRLQDENADEQLALVADKKVSDLVVSGLARRFGEHKIISEEAIGENNFVSKDCTWLVDPIDGTHHYLAKDKHYAVMVGLLKNGKPIFGWVYNAAYSLLYFGGERQGIVRRHKNGSEQPLSPLSTFDNSKRRIILGRRDHKSNIWLESVAGLEIIQAGSIGYKVSRILENEADVLVHLSGRLKVWDTAGPVALALAAGLEVGSEKVDGLNYLNNSLSHEHAIVIGKKGSLNWFRSEIIPVWKK